MVPDTDSEQFLVFLYVTPFDGPLSLIIRFCNNARDRIGLNPCLLPSVLVNLPRRIQRQKLNTGIREQIRNTLLGISERINFLPERVVEAVGE